MNITNNQTTENTNQTTLKDNTSSTNAEKISATKREEKKDTQTSSSEEKSEFQKYLEEPQSTDKANLEQVQQLHQNPNIINEQYINKFGFDTVSSLQNLKTSYNYDTVKISKDDAKFFADLVENKQFALQQNGETQNLIKFADEIGPTYKTQQTSQILTDLISKAYNEQKPVRIDFDKNFLKKIKVVVGRKQRMEASQVHT